MSKTEDDKEMAKLKAYKEIKELIGIEVAG